jgi:hypothetical protein
VNYTPPPPSPPVSGFSIVTCLASTSSLVSSLITTTQFVIPSIKPGFYGGTAVLVLLALCLQIVGLVALVAIPAFFLSQILSRPIRLTRTAKWLLLAAILAIVAESIFVFTIPVTGHC